MRRVALIVVLVGAAALVWFLREGGDDAASTPPVGDAPQTTQAPAPQLEGNAPPPRASEDAEPASAPGAIVVAIGRVVDSTRRPVAGATVLAFFDDVETARATSDETGAFSLPLGEVPPETRFGRMWIRRGPLGADRKLFLHADTRSPLDYGRIVLGALHALSVHVVRDGASVAGASVVAGDAMAGRGRGRLLRARTDAAGMVLFEGLAGAKVSVFAWAPGAGRAFGEVELPRGKPFEVALPEDRSATIRVMRAGSEAPVAGAEVHLAGAGTLPFPGGTGCLPPLGDLRTGVDGTVLVSGLPPGHVWVVARAPGLAMRSGGLQPERVMLTADENEKTVTLHPYRTVRFPIRGEHPAEGTVLTLRRYQPLTGYDVGTPQARIEDGQLVLASFPPAFDWGHVVAPDGTWASWRAPPDKDVGEAVTFRPIRDVPVRLTYRDGTPAVGEVLWAILRPRGRLAPRRTDAEGRTVFEGCVAETATIMWTSTDNGFGMPLGRVDLGVEEAERTFVIDRPVDIVVRIRIDDEPRIPEHYELRVPDLDPDMPSRDGREVRSEIQEDPGRGELRLRWVPMPSGEAPPITIRPRGLPAATATPVQDADGVWRATLDLHTSTTLRVRVTPPEGGRYGLRVERWDAKRERYVHRYDDPAFRGGQRGVGGVHTFRGYAPGRYRLAEHFSGITSESFDLTEGGAALQIEFDLSISSVLAGRIEVPEGDDPAFATVRVEGRGAGTASQDNPLRVGADGRFELRGRGGEEARLVVTHPLLRPREPATEAVFGGEPVVVALVAGPQVAFRLAGSDFTTRAPDPSTYPPYWGPVRMRVARAGASLAEAPPITAIAKDGVFRVGVPEAGPWQVRIEQSGFVPHRVEAVAVGAGRADLGTIAMDAGATLTVRLQGGADVATSRLQLEAVRVGAFPYTASSYQVQEGDPPFLRVSGLGRGVFRVVVKRLLSGGPPLFEQQVESDGSTPLTVDATL